MYTSTGKSQVVATDLEVSTEGSDGTMMLQNDFVNAFTKRRYQSHFAAILMEKLFDEDTRVRSIVCGKGKEKLDPTIIRFFIYITFYVLKWVKQKTFQYHPSTKKSGKSVYRPDSKTED